MRRTIYINSNNRDIGGTDSDFTITRNVVEFSNPPRRAKLVSASIPYTWYNVTSDNNTFTIIETVAGTDSFAIPPGNYDGETLAATIQTLLNTSGVLTPTFTVTFDASSFKYTITTSINTFQIVFAASGSAALILGFTADSTNPGVAAASVMSTGTAQLLPDYELFICSDLVSGSDNGVMLWSPTYVPSLTNMSQIMVRVPIVGCYSGVINYTSPGDLPWYNVTQSTFDRAVELNKPASIRFFLVLPSGLSIDLNGYHWSAEIVLEW